MQTVAFKCDPLNNTRNLIKLRSYSQHSRRLTSNSTPANAEKRGEIRAAVRRRMGSLRRPTLHRHAGVVLRRRNGRAARSLRRTLLDAQYAAGPRHPQLRGSAVGSTREPRGHLAPPGFGVATVDYAARRRIRAASGRRNPGTLRGGGGPRRDGREGSSTSTYYDRRYSGRRRRRRRRGRRRRRVRPSSLRRPAHG